MVDKWKEYVEYCDQDLITRKIYHYPVLEEPHPLEGKPQLPLHNNNSWPECNTGKDDMDVCTALMVSANTPLTDVDICFCCTDEPTIELIKLVCCLQTVHSKCLIAILALGSCSKLDICVVLDYPIIDRSPATAFHLHQRNHWRIVSKPHHQTSRGGEWE